MARSYYWYEEISGDLRTFSENNWDKVFKNGPSKICGRQPLKNLKGSDLLKQTLSLQVF